jgi:hypothetical protein
VSGFSIDNSGRVMVVTFETGVPEDIMDILQTMTPALAYRHDSAAHVAAHFLSALVGPSVHVPVRDGRLALGEFQKIVLMEFEGPRRRQIEMRLLAEARSRRSRMAGCGAASGWSADLALRHSDRADEPVASHRGRRSHAGRKSVGSLRRTGSDSEGRHAAGRAADLSARFTWSSITTPGALGAGVLARRLPARPGRGTGS